MTNGSRCIGAGTNLATGTDIFGHPWSNPPSIGCAEWQPAPATAAAPQIQYGFVPAGFAVTIPVAGQPPFVCTWFNNGIEIGSTATTTLVVTNATIANAGAFQVVVSNAYGAATSGVITLTIHCADAAGTNPVPPYLDWSTAATNIQGAINAANNGDLILVTNGTYATGGVLIAGEVTTNRIALNKPVSLQSVNGPWVTVIEGGGPVTGPAAVRCAWVTNNAVLSGFTLKWGGTGASGVGGGVWCVSSNAIVANCVIVSNTAADGGGGAYQGTLNNCLFIGNASVNGWGGGAVTANLSSCTVVNNTCPSYGGGTCQCSATNCIIYSNSSPNYSSGTLDHCCTTPLPSGTGNFTAPPQLFADNVHLVGTSPCIGAGTNLVTGTDIFGQPWSNPPSIGCAEWQPAPHPEVLQIQFSSPLPGFSVLAAC